MNRMNRVNNGLPHEANRKLKMANSAAAGRLNSTAQQAEHIELEPIPANNVVDGSSIHLDASVIDLLTGSTDQRRIEEAIGNTQTELQQVKRSISWSPQSEVSRSIRQKRTYSGTIPLVRSNVAHEMQFISHERWPPGIQEEVSLGMPSFQDRRHTLPVNPQSVPVTTGAKTEDAFCQTINTVPSSILSSSTRKQSPNIDGAPSSTKTSFSPSESCRVYVELPLLNQDVIFFQGNRRYVSRGTEIYLDLVEQQHTIFGRTTSRKKKGVCKKQIMDYMLSINSRFIRQDRSTKQYYLLTEKEVLEAISSSLWYACFKNKNKAKGGGNNNSNSNSSGGNPVDQNKK